MLYFCFQLNNKGYIITICKLDMGKKLKTDDVDITTIVGTMLESTHAISEQMTEKECLSLAQRFTRGIYSLPKDGDVRMYYFYYSKKEKEANVKNVGNRYMMEMERVDSSTLDSLLASSVQRDPKLSLDDLLIVEAKVPVSSIDFNETIRCFSESPNREEVILKNTRDVKILKAYKFYDLSYVE